MELKLYELADEFRQSMAAIEAAGLDENAMRDSIEAAAADIETKLRNVVAYALELERVAEAHKELGKFQLGKAKTISAKSEWLLTYAYDCMKRAGITKPIVYPEFTLHITSNRPAVNVLDIGLLPSDCVKIIPEERVPDKEVIYRKLKAGERVPGAELKPATGRLAVR